MLLRPENTAGEAERTLANGWKTPVGSPSATGEAPEEDRRGTHVFYSPATPLLGPLAARPAAPVGRHVRKPIGKRELRTQQTGN
jgi:hypothetical protein